jgi:hypothetical protein
MKRTLFVIAFIIISCSFTYAQKYWENSNIANGFDKTKTYKVAILPVISNDAELTGEASLLDMATKEINNDLTGVSKFQIINQQLVQETINKYKFSGGILNTSDYTNIANETGADLLVYCELSKDHATIKKTDVSTVMAYIQVFNAKNSFSAVYTSKARMILPVSKQAEMEFAIQKALKKLIDYLK